MITNDGLPNECPGSRCWCSCCTPLCQVYVRGVLLEGDEASLAALEVYPEEELRVVDSGEWGDDDLDDILPPVVGASGGGKRGGGREKEKGFKDTALVSSAARQRRGSDGGGSGSQPAAEEDDVMIQS